LRRRQQEQQQQQQQQQLDRFTISTLSAICMYIISINKRLFV